MRHDVVFVAALAAAFAAITSAASAAPITFRFGGAVTVSEVAGIAVGDAINGTYTFDSDATSAPLAGPSSVVYDPALLSYNVQVGSFLGSASSGFIIVSDNHPASILTHTGVFDGYSAAADLTTTTPIAGLTVGRSFVSAIDSTATALSSVDLPLSPPNLSDFAFRTYFIMRFWDANNVRHSVEGTFTSLEAVPSPGALTLIGLGLFALVATRRPRWRAQGLSP